jgi:hypothetical protein
MNMEECTVEIFTAKHASSFSTMSEKLCVISRKLLFYICVTNSGVVLKFHHLASDILFEEYSHLGSDTM